MLRSRLLSITAITTAAVALSGCLATPMGPYNNAGYYNNNYQTNYPTTNYPTNTAQATVAPSNFYGRAQVVNVQTYQGNSAPGAVPGATGAVIGGLAGGAIGNQIAKNRENDRTRATLAGAAVGALIGAAIQHQGFNNYANQPVYRVTVRAMDNNNLYYFDYPQNPGVQIGEYVQVQGNQLYRLNY